MRCCFGIEMETEKAVLIETQAGWAPNTTRTRWVPKSVCTFEEYVATTDYKGNPLTYGKRVVEIEDWFARRL